MDFEFDKGKNAANKKKHGIDFAAAQELWKDEERFEFQSRSNVELRYITVGRIEEKYWTAVFTYRENTIRLISVRRSRKSERMFYENKRRRI